MLHFRFTLVLKELYKPNLSRPFSGIARNKTSLTASYCFSTACANVKLGYKLKSLRVGGHLPARSISCGTRYLCTKTDAGSVTATENAKNELSKEAAAEKWVAAEWMTKITVTLTLCDGLFQMGRLHSRDVKTMNRHLTDDFSYGQARIIYERRVNCHWPTPDPPGRLALS